MRNNEKFRMKKRKLVWNVKEEKRLRDILKMNTERLKRRKLAWNVKEGKRLRDILKNNDKIRLKEKYPGKGKKRRGREKSQE